MTSMAPIRSLAFAGLLLLLGHPPVLAASADGDHFKQIYEAEWAFRLKEFPLLATSAGVHQYDAELSHVSEQDQLRRYTYWEDINQQLEEISCDRLSREECINYRLFSKQIDDFMAAYQTKSYLIPFTSDEGFYVDWSRLPAETDFGSVQDYRNYTSRLHLMGVVMDEYIALMRTGLELKFTQPQVILSGRDEPIKAQLVDRADKSPFFAPFLTLPQSLEQGRTRRVACCWRDR